MEQWSEIRRRVLVEGVSKRQILRETGMHYRTLEKILAQSSIPGYRLQAPRAKPRLGDFCARIDELLKQDEDVGKKQRHTAKRIFERLVEEGYAGSYTQVREYVRQVRRSRREVFLPIEHRPGEAQCDFGEALAKIDGHLRKIKFFVMVLPYSGCVFATAFENEKSECWWEGHNRAFEFFGGVPRRISYDNASALVWKVLHGRERKQTSGLRELVSHYLFEPHFCHVRRANEKGVVENSVGYVRRNWLVPVPQAASVDEISAQLVENCRADLRRKARGKRQTKAELLEQERAALLALPAAPFDACRKVSGMANSMSTVRFEGNDYSVPVRFAHHPVQIKGYVDRVEIYSSREQAAVHKRLFGSGEVSLDPLHYLPLLEKKPGGLDHGLPFRNWQLPACFDTLRKWFEERLGASDGAREYIGVLLLLNKHPMAQLERVVATALQLGVAKADAIALLAADRPQARIAPLHLDGREHLRHVVVAVPDLEAYTALLSGAAA